MSHYYQPSSGQTFAISYRLSFPQMEISVPIVILGKAPSSIALNATRASAAKYQLNHNLTIPSTSPESFVIFVKKPRADIFDSFESDFSYFRTR